MATGFPRFAELPFEIRELIWEEAAFQPVRENGTPSETPITWNAPASYAKATSLGSGNWVTYREQGPRSPAIAQVCRQSRTVALKSEFCRQTDSNGSSSWISSTDSILIKHISPRVLLGTNARLIATSGPSIALHMSAFTTQQQSSPLYLFEFLNRANKFSSFVPKIIVLEVTLHVTAGQGVSSTLFDPIPQDHYSATDFNPDQERYSFRLVSVRNKSLVNKVIAATNFRYLLWPHFGVSCGVRIPWMQFDTQNLEAQWEALAEWEMWGIEDLWLDEQFAAWRSVDESTKKDVLHSGKRFKRDHPWVKAALARMPKFEPVVLFQAKVVELFGTASRHN
ncbi:hypothetical protein MKZ38_006704 [Zalerion maritima]|uniref:2EXR domain-containing protein n=1 Tax=Zalerion maritima TaxID=339359 RepID=A0AAD5RJP1_9PEZI|nr:hypothetical protein MKZ38_006704 [Zalerion maritima]